MRCAPRTASERLAGQARHCRPALGTAGPLPRVRRAPAVRTAAEQGRCRGAGGDTAVVPPGGSAPDGAPGEGSLSGGAPDNRVRTPVLAPGGPAPPPISPTGGAIYFSPGPRRFFLAAEAGADPRARCRAFQARSAAVGAGEGGGAGGLVQLGEAALPREGQRGVGDAERGAARGQHRGEGAVGAGLRRRASAWRGGPAEVDPVVEVAGRVERLDRAVGQGRPRRTPRSGTRCARR